jgi:hypothetical protein
LNNSFTLEGAGRTNSLFPVILISLICGLYDCKCTIMNPYLNDHKSIILYLRTIYLSIYLSIYLCIYLWLYSPLLGLVPCSLSYAYTQWVGLLGQGISPSQGLRHPCPEWDSNPRSQHSSGRRQFMA